MDVNQKYALYDEESGEPKKWVAHLRLTPELLQRLQMNPSSVSIRLNSNANNTKKQGKALNSTITVHNRGVDDATESTEHYELLSFPEDPQVNRICVFRAPMSSEDTNGNTEPSGYVIKEIGRVHQKLIVQRLLDTTEKDRMKDRHAKSVIESKSRASKRIENVDAVSRTTRRSVVHLKQAQQPPLVHDEKPVSRNRHLPSALSLDAIREIEERIEHGPPVTTPTKDVEDKALGLFSSDMESEEALPSKATHNILYSPPEDDEVKHVSVKKPRIDDYSPRTKPENQHSKSDPTPLPSMPLPIDTTDDTILPPVISTNVHKPIKRARPRASPKVNLSFLSDDAQAICKRISSYITRTLIRDEIDYEQFLSEYERLEREWEQLDRSYSIELIMRDKAWIIQHINTGTNPKTNRMDEDLEVVRNTMQTIKNILKSLQTSITTYEQKS